MCLLPVTTAFAQAPAEGDSADAERLLAVSSQAEQLLKDNEPEQARVLLQPLLARTDLRADVEVGAIAAELLRMDVANDWAGLDALRARVYAAAELPTDIPSRVTMLHRMGAVYYRSARFDETLKSFDAAIELGRDSPSEVLMIALRSRGAVLAQQGRYPEAIDSLHQAEKLNTALGLPEDVSILRNLAGLYIQRQDFERAIAFATRGEKAQRNSDPPQSSAARLGMLSVLAAAHIGAGNREEAHRWSEASITYARENGLPASSLINNLATLLRDEGRNQEALERFQEAKAQISAGDRAELHGILEKNIGETLIALGQRERADTHLQAARKIYVTVDVRANRLELYPVLIDNLEALGRPADALAAMREFKTLSDETNTAESEARIGELESQIDLERKTKELVEAQAAGELQRAANQTLAAEGERSRTVNLALAGVVMVMLLGLALLLRHQRARARNLRELALRNTEIETQRSALQSLNAVIHQQNLEDALTGLGNRRRFNEVMASLSTGSALPPALLVMADLDHFKQINDQHGHAVGDLALKHFADALRTVARGQDLLVRWGGEEFAWLCPDASPAQGGALCERLLRQLHENPMRVDGHTLKVGVSLGFVPLPVWPGTRTDWQTALRIADHAVYCAKAEGRGRWCGYAGGLPLAQAEGLSVEDMESRGHLLRLGVADEVTS